MPVSRLITVEEHVSLKDIAATARRMGPDHVIWSEDYPYLQNEQPRAFLDAAPIADDVREKIAHGNAEALLGL